MIRSVGPLGPLKVIGLVLWELRGTLLAILIVVGLLVPVPDATQSEYAAAVLSVLGIGASVFIAFRNTTGYNRWWEARTLWGGIIIGSRSTHNALTAIDIGVPGVGEVLDRMRRRQVRYCWQLNAELRGVEAPAQAIALTPEDQDGSDGAAGVDATELLNRQAADVAALVAGGHVDGPTRLMLMNANTATATAQSGLERIRNEPVPIHYDLFIRGLAWFFGIMAFSRLDGANHPPSSVVVGILLMTTFIVAERLGRFIEQPMNNSIFDISMNRICATITGNLLGAGHPLAQPRENDKATVWM